jgi:hypothetical protein
MERHGRDLERDACGQEGEADRQAGRQRLPPGNDRRELRGDALLAVDPGGAGQPPDERDPEQEDRRAE